MKRGFTVILVTLLAAMALAGCGAAGTDGGGATMTPIGSSSTPMPSDQTPVSGTTALPTGQPSGGYPKMGHAPDYSWIAGKVAFTRIQGSCVYVRTVDTPAASDAPTTPPGQVVVGTAVHSDTSPPLRDITPVIPAQSSTDAAGGVPQQEITSFVPSGPAWDISKVKDGDYVVLIGRLAGDGDAREMCPGGTAYVANGMQMNP